MIKHYSSENCNIRMYTELLSTDMTKSNDMLNKNTYMECKKGEANQKQYLSDYVVT